MCIWIRMIACTKLRQYEFRKEDISVAKVIVENKLRNQKTALKDTRRKDDLTSQSVNIITSCIDTLPDITDYDSLMGIEGIGAKAF